jgi:sugar O-acyltransferase (sialic acid O-acetyltransferase NeuD family)
MNETRVAILGGEGSGVIVAQAISDAASKLSQLCQGFLNDIVAPGSEIGKLPVIGHFESWRELSSDVMLITAIHKVGQMKERIARINGLEIPDSRFTTVIHPTASVAEDVVISPGAYIGPNACVMPGARIGKHASLRGGCYVSHDVQVGDWCFIGPNTVVSGRAQLEYAAHIGPGAVIREELTLGRFSVAGIGAVVVHDIPGNVTMAGNPARVLPI